MEIALPQKKSLVLSLGVGYEISADIQLIQDFGCEIYAFDPFVENPNTNLVEFKFYQIGCGETSGGRLNLEFKKLDQILKILPKNPDLAFIDIEGDEWLLAEDISLLNKLSQIVIEFHDLNKIIDDEFYYRALALFDSILKTHSPIHVHGNNDGQTVPIGGATWPGILEITFLRNDLLRGTEIDNNYGPFPTTLDSSNSLCRPDLDLQPFFGQNAKYREN